MIRLAQTTGQAGDPGIPAPPRDELSFRTFYLTRQKRMIGLVRALTAGAVTDPEGVAQDGWCKFYPHWVDCQYPDAYVRQCMISAANDALEKALSEPRASSKNPEPVLAGVESELHRPPADEQPHDPAVTAALQQLSPRLREFVLLECELELGQRSVAEIAELLGIGRSAAYARRKRAHAALLRLLPADHPEHRAARARDRDGVKGWSTP